jgi:murein hydrolase activator
MGKPMRFLFLACTLLLAFEKTLYAQPSESEQLLQKYTELREGLVKDEEERRKVLSELYKVTHVMRKIQRRQEDLMAEKARVTEKIETAGKKIEELKERLILGRSKIAVRLRELYKFSGQTSMRLMFASQSMSEFDRNSKLLRILLDHDIKMMSQHRENIKRFGNQKTQMKQDMRRLAKLEIEIENQANDLVAQQAIKNRILQSFDEATLARLKNLEELRTNSNLQARGHLETAFFEKKGKLQPPVQGPIKQKYGTLKDTTSLARMRFKGNFFEVEEGAAVRSVHGGEVAFTGPVEGYGSTVIVSHGDHYYTVYGGLSTIDTHEGENVTSGEVIGSTGRGFHLFSAGLYFEIRHFSDPVNPSDWLAGRQISFLTNDN